VGWNTNQDPVDVITSRLNDGNGCNCSLLVNSTIASYLKKSSLITNLQLIMNMYIIDLVNRSSFVSQCHFENIRGSESRAVVRDVHTKSKIDKTKQPHTQTHTKMKLLG
jgi:hypothetical protein